MSRVEPMFPDESLWFQCEHCRRSTLVTIPNRAVCQAGELLDVKCPECSRATALKDGRERPAYRPWTS